MNFLKIGMLESFIITNQIQMRATMTDYTLKKIDWKFWQKVKLHAAVKGVTIKDLILKLLEREIRA